MKSENMDRISWDTNAHSLIAETAIKILGSGDPLEFETMDDAYEALNHDFGQVQSKVIGALKEYLPKEKDMDTEEIRGIFEVILVDANECEIIKTKTAIARDPQEAILQLVPSDEQVAFLRKGIYKTVVFAYGEFRVYAKPVKIE